MTGISIIKVLHDRTKNHVLNYFLSKYSNDKE